MKAKLPLSERWIAMLYNQVKNGTRLLTGYMKDLDHWFLDQIFSEGIDVNYEDSVLEFREAFKSDVKDLTNEALNTLKKQIDIRGKENWIKNHFNWRISDQKLVETILELILQVTKHTKISELKSDLKELEDQLVEISFEYYESDSTKYFLKTKDYTVEFSNYDNSYTVLRSKLTGKFLCASPCFFNGCYSDPDLKKGFTAFRLPLDCYSDEYKEQHKEQINWKK